MDGSILLAELRRFINVLGAKLNNNPIIMYIDIAAVGFWGEWHLGSVPSPYDVDYMPNEDNEKHIIDSHIDAFPNKPLVMYMEHSASIYGTSRGAGLRCNGIGDWSSGWNLMNDLYKPRLAEFGDTWKTRIITFETAWNFEYQSNAGFDMNLTFSTAIDWHVNSIHNKDGNILPVFKDEFDNMVRKLGYRFVLKDVTMSLFKRRMKIHILNVKSTWENVGSSPIYFNAVIEWKVRIENNNGNSTHVVESSENLKSWLPFENHHVVESFVFTELEEFSMDMVHLDVCMSYYLNIEKTEKMTIALPIQTPQNSDDCYTVF